MDLVTVVSRTPKCLSVFYRMTARRRIPESNLHVSLTVHAFVFGGRVKMDFSSRIFTCHPLFICEKPRTALFCSLSHCMLIFYMKIRHLSVWKPLFFFLVDSFRRRHSRGLRTERLGFYSWQGHEIFLYSTASRSVFKPNQLRMQWVPELFPRGYSGRDMKQNTHLHLMSRSMVEL
jgi:hypothetical protein